MDYPKEGILLIDKVAGETSFDVVRKVRKALNLKKVGHAGTLDPFATGLLIVLLGRGTKLSPFLMENAKTYLATLRLGIETDTHDPSGRILRQRPVPDLDRAFIEDRVLRFTGEIQQVPPAFSALKYKGRRAYEWARKGLPVELKSRIVKIHSLRVISVRIPDVTIEVRCSTGTYIRALAHDLGEELHTGAHLAVLRRTSIGPFAVKAAVSSDSIDPGASGPIRDRIIPLREALPHIRKVEVDHPTAGRIRSGCRSDILDRRFPDIKEGLVQLVTAGELVAVLRVKQPSTGPPGVEAVRVFQ